jgi:outer membrane protein TolC
LANRQKQEGAALRIELSELQQRPSFGFGLDYAFVSERTDINVEDNGKEILMPMLSVSLPIFGKKNKALKKEAELNNESLAQRKIGLENEIKNDWTKADFLERSAEKELSLYEKEIRNTQSLLNVLTSEYSNNSSNFEELLLTQQRLFQLQIAQVKAAIQKERALFQKKYLTGKFFNQ